MILADTYNVDMISHVGEICPVSIDEEGIHWVTLREVTAGCLVSDLGYYKHKILDSKLFLLVL